MDTYENQDQQQTQTPPLQDVVQPAVSEELHDTSLADLQAQIENQVQAHSTETADLPEQSATNTEVQEDPLPETQTHNSVATETQTAPKSSKKLWLKIGCGVLAVAVLIGCCALTAFCVNHSWDERMEQMAHQVDTMEQRFKDKFDALKTQIGKAASSAPNDGNSVSGSPVVSVEGMTPSQVYAANVNSVVLITASVSTSTFGQSGTAYSTGSGFILSEDGYVVTNCHVVQGANAITVQTVDGTIYEATLIGSDSPNDIAVLKAEATGLQPVKLGTSSNLIVGDQVVAIGNPLGELTSTLTVGYVSAKERNVNTDGTVINMIQTDAAINSGNSGGPLFNMKGEVIGITTAKYSGTSTSGASIEGIGFAIPLDDVLDMIEDLVTYGYITGAYLGISVSDTDPEAASYFGYPIGAYVHEVVPGYCAEKAGIQPKDVIVELGGYDVTGLNDLSRALRNLEAGQNTTVVVFRSGQELVLSITLDEKPQTETEENQSQEPTYPEENRPSSGYFDDWFDNFFGN